MKNVNLHEHAPMNPNMNSQKHSCSYILGGRIISGTNLIFLCSSTKKEKKKKEKGKERSKASENLRGKDSLAFFFSSRDTNSIFVRSVLPRQVI